MSGPRKLLTFKEASWLYREFKYGYPQRVMAEKSLDAVRHYARVTERARIDGRDIAAPTFPAHLRWYLPGAMDLSPMRPNELWDTDITIGRAMQEAWREGRTPQSTGTRWMRTCANG